VHTESPPPPAPKPTVTDEGRTEKLGLKLSKSDDESFDRIFSTYGFESSEFLRTGSGFPDVSIPGNNKQGSAGLRKSVNKAFSGSGAVDVPVTGNGGGPSDSSHTSQPSPPAGYTKEAPLLEDGFNGDFGEWMKGFSERGDEYRAVTRSFTVEGKRVFSYFMRDDSMAPVIGEGDLLFVDLDEEFTRVDGGIGLVRREGVTTVRCIYEEDDYWRLSPANPKYSSGVVPKKSTDVLKIVFWLPRTDDKF
jgi:hypothetical protein